MNNKDQDPVPGGDINNEGIFSDTKTGEKIHQHLSDINDQITEEDIKNVSTGFEEESSTDSAQSDSSEEPGSDKIVTGDSKDKEEKEDTKDNHPIITPWNILGS